MEPRRKFWNVLTVLLGAAAAASIEDDYSRLAFGAAAGAFIAQAAYFYVDMFLWGEEEERKRLSWQKPSPRLAGLRVVVDRWYKAVVVVGATGGIALIAGRWSEFLFNSGAGIVALSAIAFAGVWLSIGRQRNALEHAEFGDHPDPNVRALLRGEIDLVEYSKRQTLARSAPLQSAPNSRMQPTNESRG